MAFMGLPWPRNRTGIRSDFLRDARAPKAAASVFSLIK
jgi:hypothetical protein